jgi:hypothetical protein
VVSKFVLVHALAMRPVDVTWSAMSSSGLIRPCHDPAMACRGIRTAGLRLPTSHGELGAVGGVHLTLYQSSVIQRGMLPIINRAFESGQRGMLPLTNQALELGQGGMSPFVNRAFELGQRGMLPKISINNKKEIHLAHAYLFFALGLIACQMRPSSSKRKHAEIQDDDTIISNDTEASLSKSVTSIDVPTLTEPILPDRMRNFVLFKAYDVIGNGGYRRFVLKNKNNGEKWATTLYNDTHYVSRHVRATLLLVNRLQYTASCVKLHKLCQRVINDLNPPIISTHGWCICALTGMRTENTTQLGRSNKGDACHVHRKFFKFFCMLWFIARVDLCVKYFTVQWLQTHNNEEEQNIQTLCEKFEADSQAVQSMCDRFSHAIAHVSMSVLTHIDHVGHANLLNTDA